MIAVGKLAISGQYGELTEGEVVEKARKILPSNKEESQGKEVTWHRRGTYAVISKKAFESLELYCTAADIERSLSQSYEQGEHDNEWNCVKSLGGGTFELKVKNSGKQRCEGVKGQGGLVEFKNEAKKGRGK